MPSKLYYRCNNLTFFVLSCSSSEIFRKLKILFQLIWDIILQRYIQRHQDLCVISFFELMVLQISVPLFTDTLNTAKILCKNDSVISFLISELLTAELFLLPGHRVQAGLYWIYSACNCLEKWISECRQDIYIKSHVHKLPWQLHCHILNVSGKFIFTALSVSGNEQWSKIGQLMNNILTE